MIKKKTWIDYTFCNFSDDDTKVIYLHVKNTIHVISIFVCGSYIITFHDEMWAMYTSLLVKKKKLDSQLQ
jgi:hypothetical protein